ncbi:DNA polymerase III subunit beta [Eubacterium sp. An3]|uniref:DNA polymerase III subunit beta n=1 Tax=Eubacterium sp. An3 TaxID=1965628 RepID=UPI000B37E6BC|nr:DNA polymerase III subunit beta [Eubacterium sp. An3]OUO25915.1 hypothetical protein B5F87_16010 [Eubacterium sp. An3]
MKVTVNTKAFSNALKELKEIAGGQTLTGEAVRFDISQTEMDMTVHGAHGTSLIVRFPSMNLDGDNTSFVVDIKKLYAVIPQLCCESLMIVKANSGLRIAGEGVRIELPYYDLSTFKSEKLIVEPEVSLSVSADALKESLLNTAHALAVNKTGEKTSAFFLEFTDTGIRCTATDGYRVSVHGDKGAAKCSIIIPNEAVRKIIRYLSGNVRIQKKGDSVEIADDTTVLKVVALSGAYFDIAKIFGDFESRLNKKATVKTADLLNATQLALAMLDSGDDSKVLTIAMENNSFIITVKGQEGAFQQTLDADIKMLGQDPVTLYRINGQYLASALRVLKEEDVTIHFGNEREPFIIKEDTNIELLLLNVSK